MFNVNQIDMKLQRISPYLRDTFAFLRHFAHRVWGYTTPLMGIAHLNTRWTYR
jgi:hypothetical protein